jgi:serine/threonine-protein kinase
MDGESSPGSGALPLTLAGRVDAACDRFEADWKAGRRPRIDAYLADAAESERPALLRELLMLELEFRGRLGERPGVEEYRARFPGHRAIIDTLLEPTRIQEPAPRAGTRGRPDTERDLLFGILAVQMGFISLQAFAEGMQARARDESRPLGEILVGQGALSGPQQDLIETMVQGHGAASTKECAASGAAGVTREGRERVHEDDLRANPADRRITEPRAGDPRAARAGSVGASTSSGTRFRILRPHARGGLGQVYVARDEELHRDVALKELQHQFAYSPRSRQRFLQEAEITGGLEHPGIVPVYGLGHDADGRPFYAMRFIRGVSLKEAIERFHGAGPAVSDPGERALELRKLLGRFLDVCDATAYAHSRGVLHRDLKPANIMLGQYGETLVVDWGLAKPIDRPESGAIAGELPLVPSSASGTPATLPGTTVGTPQFMSPEQAAGRLELLGPASDVYSLGATLYCLLTGRAPFEGGDLDAVLQGVQRGDFPPPRRVDAAVPPALEGICLKAMATGPADRYASPRDLSEDIERWLADEPVSAWREPWPARARRWLGRHQTAMTAAAAAIIVAAAGLAAVSVVQAGANLRLRESRDLLVVAVDDATRANRELRQANARERQARAEAQRRFALARKAVESYYTGASEDVLLKQPHLASLRNKLLNTSLAFYEELQGELEQEGRDDPATRAELAAAYARVGEITEQVGTRASALEALGRARAIRESLMTADPSAAGPRRDLAGVLETIGILQSRTSGREAEALPTLERALALREEVAAARPDSADDRAAVAATLRRMGNSLFPLGRAAQALRYLERARTILEQLEAEYPDRESIRSEAANVLKQLSYIERVSDRLDDSLRDLGRARQILERLAADHPGDAKYGARLAEVLSDLGSDLATAGRLPEALDAEQRALAIHERLAAESPANTDYRYMIATHRTAIGWILGELGRRDEAPRPLARAREELERLVADHPDNLFFRRQLAQCVGFLGTAEHERGRRDEAFEALERARALYERLPGETLDLYNLACIDSRLVVLAQSDSAGEAVPGRGDAYADKAIAALRRAVAAGYKRVDSLRNDPDLAPLRSREDFQRILLDAAFPDDPFAR